MVNPIATSVSIKVFNTPEEAIEGGYNYRQDRPEIKPIELQEIVLVRNGTVNGNPTVDFIVKDDSGQEFIFMMTRNMLASIPS